MRGTNQFAVFYSGNKWNAWFGSASVSFYGGYTGRKVVSLDKSTFSVDGTSSSISSGTFTSTLPIILFGFCQSNKHMYAAEMKLYSCQIYDNDVLVRDFVPCIKDDGEVGLYDIVGQQFYGNAGTGVFTGSEVA